MWKNDNLRLFLLSEFIGIFGSHFYQIALPWLVMQFTGSVAAMGTAIALTGVSRVALMMVGGTLSDRFSPRALILTAAGFRATLLALLTGVIAIGRMDLLMLYGFCLASGVADAIFMPARGSVMPLLVEQEMLKAANSIAFAQEKIWGLVGPTMAGLIITWLGHLAGPSTKNFFGPAVAFTINILTLIISIAILRPVKFAAPSPLPQAVEEPEEPIETVQDGSLIDLVRLIWKHANLRISFLMVYAINALSSGPLYIGMPMLVVSRFSEGAQALGFMTSALGCGALLGTLMAGLLPQPKPQKIGRSFLAVLVGIAVGLIILLTVVSIGADAAAVLVLAAMLSYVNVMGLVQIQRDTPPAFMGRMMGLLNLK